MELCETCLNIYILFLQTPTHDQVARPSLDTSSYLSSPFVPSLDTSQSCRTVEPYDKPLFQEPHSMEPYLRSPGNIPPIEDGGIRSSSGPKHGLEPEETQAPSIDAQSQFRRVLRPRSRTPRDYIPVVANAGRKRGSTASLPAANLASISSGYQQLSVRDVQNLKLDSNRRHYKCLVDGCNRVFGRKSNAENHIRTHLDDKPFVCSLAAWYVRFERVPCALCSRTFNTVLTK